MDSNHIVVDTHPGKRGPATTRGGSLKFPHRNNGSYDRWKVEDGKTVYRAVVAAYAKALYRKGA